MLVFVVASVVLLLAAAVICYPLFVEPLEEYDLPEAELPAETFTERDALLEALSDLELSFQSGKLSEDAYKTQKARLQREYIATVESPGQDEAAL